ncbi:MAG: DUF4389 domain-containing protein [Ketobacteraceae bacterium]|nr:DUF4389 domain-containing protein [Ketobacteraceae bacterium]
MSDKDTQATPDKSSNRDKEKEIEVIIADESETDEDPILLRLVYAILFYFVYAMSRFLIGVVAIVQFLHILLTEEYQEDLLRFSRSLTRYVSQIVGYMTWVSNTKPFPFTDWPSDANEREEG